MRDGNLQDASPRPLLSSHNLYYEDEPPTPIARVRFDWRSQLRLFKPTEGKRVGERSFVFTDYSRDNRVLAPLESRLKLDPPGPYLANDIRNYKYTLLNFVPLFLYEQFRYFFNVYFLVVALSQFIPVLQVGFRFTFIAPLVFVLGVAMAKEAVDDNNRHKRDREVNSQIYERLTPHGIQRIPSRHIRVGDFLRLRQNQRVPADCVLLRSKESSIFIRTDQMDGETDWKLRLPVHGTQQMSNDDMLWGMQARLTVAAPTKEIYDFRGNFCLRHEDGEEGELESLSLENTLWSSSVVATDTIIVLVIYTGSETRAVMNAGKPIQKTGLTDLELNDMSKVLFILNLLFAGTLASLKGFNSGWSLFFLRFVLLLNSIVPISLRVNLEMSKTVYSYMIEHDEAIAGTVVRSSTIPEELARLSYLFTDKTGTLTTNNMSFKVLQLQPPIVFTRETKDSLARHVRRAYGLMGRRGGGGGGDAFPGDEEEDMPSTRNLRLRNSDLKDDFASVEVVARVQHAVLAMALCHNVTPAYSEDGAPSYQASSPDEIAMVQFAESVGLKLTNRTLEVITLQTPTGELACYDILALFPFTSDRKRMGIVVRDQETAEITFFLKGADTVMKNFLISAEWLEEEVDHLARAGLRTLVFGSKQLSEQKWKEFEARYRAARGSIKNRDAQLAAAIETLEMGLEMVGLSGVEDRLQEDVKASLETLRNAGIKIWMLTGDKVETATCIATSARMVERGQDVFMFTPRSPREALSKMDEYGALGPGVALVIDGPALNIVLTVYKREFLELACQAPTVLVCRCSPTQKAQVVEAVKLFTGKRCAAVGDGGNDVSMIQAADVGIGIVGKEGKQASLAADFSIEQFSYITRLMLWHGRNSYQRTASLAQFVIHRGVTISVIQAVFSAIFFFSTLPIYTGWLMVGYSTYYTMFPVFALVLDVELKEETVFLYPQLYQDLQAGKPLNYRTFFACIFVSVFQGGVIMILGSVLFERQFLSIVSITFTALILSELLNIALVIHKWHPFMLVAEVCSLVLFVLSTFILTKYFNIEFMYTWPFFWKVALITCVSWAPIAIFKAARRALAPDRVTKLRDLL